MYILKAISKKYNGGTVSPIADDAPCFGNRLAALTRRRRGFRSKLNRNFSGRQELRSDAQNQRTQLNNTSVRRRKFSHRQRQHFHYRTTDWVVRNNDVNLQVGRTVFVFCLFSRSASEANVFFAAFMHRWSVKNNTVSVRRIGYV